MELKPQTHGSIEWEIQGSKNENVGTIPGGNNVNHQQFYFVLYAKL
jgi:hypothetical protein